MTIVSNDLLITIQFLMFLSANILQIYVLALYGDQLIEKSSSVGIRAYESEWYSCSVQDMKAIQLIILRSQKPCFISIANVAIVQKETFKEVRKFFFDLIQRSLNIHLDRYFTFFFSR